MSDDDIFKGLRMKGGMEELMKSEEGRELATKLRSKLKELNDKFTGLSGDEKSKFLTDFREKFADSLGELPGSLNTKMDDNPDGAFKIREDISDFAPQKYLMGYFPFLVAVFVIVLVFG